MPYVGSAPLRTLADDSVIDRYARAVVIACGNRLLELVTLYTPVATPGEPRARRPGTLKGSWFIGDVDVRGAVGSVEVLTLDPIAPHVEYPTRPHIIRPRADRRAASVVETKASRGTVKDGRAALRFVVGGRVVFAREVRHPGTRGSRMMGQAIDRLSAEWPGIARGVRV